MGRGERKIEFFSKKKEIFFSSHTYLCRVITREADLVTAHEFGHNWGSEHDPDSAECSPSASQV